MTAPTHHDEGRVLYSSLVPIWDSTTGNIASFETSFSFRVYHLGNYAPGDELIFFLTDQLNATIPKNADGGLLGVADAKNAFNRFVGVEFDNYVNPWDPNYTHIGINLNSLYSTKIMSWRYKRLTMETISIIYNSLSSTLTVVATDEDGQISTLSQQLDLKWLSLVYVYLLLQGLLKNMRSIHGPSLQF
jgi:hypothetical protein